MTVIGPCAISGSYEQHSRIVAQFEGRFLEAATLIDQARPGRVDQEVVLGTAPTVGSG